MFKKAESAFTLIELLVVLAIVGSAGAMVVPNLWKTYQRSMEHSKVMAYANQWLAVRRELHFGSSSLAIPEDALVRKNSTKFPSVPQGWVVTRNSAVYFLPTGVTGGGEILLNAPSGRVWQLQMRPVDAQVSVTSIRTDESEL